MTDPQIAEAQTKFKAIIAKTETRQIEQVEPNETKAPPMETRPLRFKSELEPFAMDFPSMPKRIIVQDQPQVDGVYYLSRSADDRTQYSLSFQTFKNQQLLDDPAQTKFFNDYLSARAMMSVDSKLYRKFIRFRGFAANRFKHNTMLQEIEMTHEGILFLIGDTAISLTCVYPAQTSPSPTFKEFTASFELIKKDPNDLL